MDVGLSQGASVKTFLVARLLEVEDLVMTTGAALVLDPLVAALVVDAPPLFDMARAPRYRAAIATNLYRLALADAEEAKRLVVAMSMNGTDPLALTIGNYLLREAAEKQQLAVPRSSAALRKSRQ